MVFPSPGFVYTLFFFNGLLSWDLSPLNQHLGEDVCDSFQAFYEANLSFAHVFNRVFPDVAAIAAIEMFEIMFAPKTLTLKENCPLSPCKVDPKTSCISLGV